MDNPINNLIINITNYFVNCPATKEVVKKHKNISALIRIHNEKLAQMGDISFPSNPEIWMKYFKKPTKLLNEHAFEILNDKIEIAEDEKNRFLSAADEWLCPVARLDVRQERCHLHLKRSTLIRCLVPEVLRNSNYGHLKKDENQYVFLNPLPTSDMYNEVLSLYRSKLMHNVLQKLLTYSRWNTVKDIKPHESNKSVIKLNIQSVVQGNSKALKKTAIAIKCGLVSDPLTKGRLCQLTVEDYLSLRSNDMTLIALHKYGIRAKQDARFCAQMECLGSAAVTVDLLEVKHTSPVKIIRNGQGSTKGASFILYNSARLESLLRAFQQRIDCGDYDVLPQLDEVQWELLTEEEEWQLVYVYVAGFPVLIDRCVEQIERGLCSTHLIIRFLHGLVAVFSVYYRRIRILTEKRDHLMPSVYARIYLVKAVREILNKTLALLTIEPVDFM